MVATAPIVRVVSANVDFQRGGDFRHVRALCQWGDVLLLQEAKDFALADMLPEGWVSLQDTTSRATKGSCIAYNGEVLEHRWERLALGARPFIGGHRIGMLTRYIQFAGLTHKETGRRFVAASAHAPPFRFRLLQPGYRARLQARADKFNRAVIGVDANAPIGGLAHQLGLEAYGKGIVGVLTRLPVVQAHVNPWGIDRGLTDHPAVVVHVALTKPKENR
jgi:hypothetical protein